MSSYTEENFVRAIDQLKTLVAQQDITERDLHLAIDVP